MCNCSVGTIKGDGFICPACGNVTKRKEEPTKFNPKVGEVYQTEDKRFKVRILAVNIKHEFTTGVLANRLDTPSHEWLSNLDSDGKFGGSKLVLFKEPKTTTLYIVMGHSGSSSIVPFRPTHPKAYLAYKKITLTEGEYDE